MTATQTQIRRDTASNLASSVPANSELAHDTTNKRVHIGDGSTNGGIVMPNFLDLQNNSFTYATAGGTANAITLTVSPTPLSLTAGLIVRFKASATNTGATTINLNSLGVKNIYKFTEGVLGNIAAGDIVADGFYEIAYDGVQFQLLGVTPPQASSAGWELLSIATASASASLDFITDIDTTYDTYAFVLDALKPASGTPDLWIRIRNTGSGSFRATGYAHQRIQLSLLPAADGDASDTKIIAIDSISSSASDAICGVVYFSQLSSGRLPRVWGSVYSADSGVNQDLSNFSGVYQSTTDQIDGLRFLFSAGNITEGTVKMYGIRSSL